MASRPVASSQQSCSPCSPCMTSGGSLARPVKSASTFLPAWTFRNLQRKGLLRGQLDLVFLCHAADRLQLLPFHCPLPSHPVTPGGWLNEDFRVDSTPSTMIPEKQHLLGWPDGPEHPPSACPSSPHCLLFTGCSCTYNDPCISFPFGVLSKPGSKSVCHCV